jgi:hypothetical protein
VLEYYLQVVDDMNKQIESVKKEEEERVSEEVHRHEGDPIKEEEFNNTSQTYQFNKSFENSFNLQKIVEDSNLNEYLTELVKRSLKK